MEVPQTELSAEELTQREARQAATEEALSSAGSAGAALDAFAEAPPSVKARMQGRLGQSMNAAEESASTSFQQSLPALPIRMGGEPLTESVPPIATPTMTSTSLEAGNPPPPSAPVIESEWAPTAYDANAGVTSSVDQAFGADGATPEAVAGALGRVRTSDPGITSSPGQRPQIPMTPGSQADPSRIDTQHQQARELAGQAGSEAAQAVIDGPGPEQARLKEVDEERQLGEQARPQVDEIMPAPGAEDFNALELPEEVVARFDADTHEQMQASVAASRRQVAEAETQRDADRQDQLAATESQRQDLESTADQDQRTRVQEARQEIQTERRSTMESQQQAVTELERESESERSSQGERIQSRIETDEQTIDDTYATAEQDAEREVAGGEERAAQEKTAAQARSSNESWWDRATSFVRQAFTALTSAINRIFDAVRATVHSLLERARELARTVIEAATAFITAAITAFGDLLKGLVDALLGDIFPGLAQALNEAIDRVVERANATVNAIADGLMQGVDALVDMLQASLDAILDIFQGALNSVMGILEAVFTGDWSAVFARILEAVLGLVGIDPEDFYALVDRVRDSLGIIIRSPGQFLANLINAVVQGFQSFADNFLTHLREGIIAWLTDALGDIEMPERWDLPGVLSIVTQVLGVTWDWVRDRASTLVGERNVERLEFLRDTIRNMLTEGLPGLFRRIQESVADLQDLVMGQIREFLQISIVQAAITRLASLFSPVGALINAVVAIWNVFTFLRDQLARIFEVVRSVVESLHRIVMGVVDGAAQQIEAVLARSLPLVIDFLARLLGLGGIAARVRAIIERVRDRIIAAVDKVLNKILRLFRRGGEVVEEMIEDDTSEPVSTEAIEAGDEQTAADPAEVDRTEQVRTQRDDKPDPDLVRAVSGGKIDAFLMAVARGDATFTGLELPAGRDLDTQWDEVYWGRRNNPSREWLKARFRKSGGQHEWLPTNYIGEVIDRARRENDGDRAKNAGRWIVFQTTFRSDTRILFFDPDSAYSRVVNGLRDPLPPHDRREDTERDYKVLQGHVGAVYAPVGSDGYVDKVQAQTVGQGRWHDGLRDIFTRNAGAATTLSGITTIMDDVATYADETLWHGGHHSGHGFAEYYASRQAAADGRTIDPGTLATRASSTSDEIERTIARTRRAVLEVRLP